jgi:tetratricopeptide (TPR) repeat protein
MNIAVAYNENGEMNKALEFCRKKLAVLTTTSGNNHTRIAQTLITMAQVIEEKNLNMALQCYNEALANLKKSIPIDQRAIAKCLHFMGRLYSIYLKFDDALPNLLKALALYSQYLSFDHIDIADVCKTIALCYQRTNKTTEALDYFNKSLLIYQAHYGSDNEKVKLIQDYIAKLNVEQQTITNSVEPVEENVNDEDLITVIVDSDARLSIVEPLPLSANNSASTSQSDRSKIKNETKTSGKRKICSDCVIL